MNVVSFVGRETEIEFLNDLVDNLFKATVFVSGEGGIGKSHLIKQFQTQCLARPSLIAPPPIDFADFSLHSLNNIVPSIVSFLGASHFPLYIRGAKALQSMRKASLSQPRKEEEEEKRTGQAFIHEYNALTKQRRGVLMFDTLDALPSDELWCSLARLTGDINNTLIVFVGRNVDGYRDYYEQISSGEVHHIHLGPLEPVDSSKYLDEKTRQLHHPLPSDTRELLLNLAAGKPIIIDLAVDMWLEQGHNIPVLSELSLEKIQKLDTTRQLEVRKEFEKSLVAGLTNFWYSEENKTILALGHLGELTKDGLMYIAEFKGDDLRLDSLWQRLCSLAVIKLLPGNRIALHDEVKRLIADFVFPRFDPDNSWRRSKSQSFLRFLPIYQSTLEENLRCLESENSIEVSDDAFIDIHHAQAYFWHVSKLYLYHTMFVNTREAIELFLSLAQKAKERFYITTHGELIDLVWPHFGKITDVEQKYRVALERIEYLRNVLEYDTAMNLVKALVSDPGIATDPNRQTELLIFQGNILVRQGKLLDGFRCFEVAVDISFINNLKSAQGRAELALGWAYRLIGNWVEATSHYLVALELATELNDRYLEALTLGNLARTRAFEDRNNALMLSEEAIRIWKELGNIEHLAHSYISKGAILYQAGKFQDALKCLDMALKTTDAPEVLCVTASWQGVTYWAESQQASLSLEEKETLLEEAERSLKTALDIGLGRETAMNLNRLARVYRSQGKVTEAWDTIWKAYQVSLESPDFLYEIACLRDISEMVIEQDRIILYGSLKEKIETYQSIWGHKSPDLGALGGALVNLGLLAIYVGDEAWGQENVSRGMEMLAEYGTYGSHTFAGYLQKFGRKVTDILNLTQRHDLAQSLQEYWTHQGLYRKYLEAMRAFRQLQQELIS